MQAFAPLWIRMIWQSAGLLPPVAKSPLQAYSISDCVRRAECSSSQTSGTVLDQLAKQVPTLCKLQKHRAPHTLPSINPDNKQP